MPGGLATSTEEPGESRVFSCPPSSYDHVDSVVHGLMWPVATLALGAR